MTDTMTPEVKKLVEQLRPLAEKASGSHPVKNGIGSVNGYGLQLAQSGDSVLTLISALEAAVERVGELEADRTSLIQSIDQAKMKVEAGQCSFSAESKHLFLKETMQILEHAEPDAARKALETKL